MSLLNRTRVTARSSWAVIGAKSQRQNVPVNQDMKPKPKQKPRTLTAKDGSCSQKCERCGTYQHAPIFNGHLSVTMATPEERKAREVDEKLMVLKARQTLTIIAVAILAVVVGLLRVI